MEQPVAREKGLLVQQKVASAWQAMPIPEADAVFKKPYSIEIARYAEMFFGKRYDKIDVTNHRVYNESPLLYMTDAGACYYVAAYLYICAGCIGVRELWDGPANHLEFVLSGPVLTKPFASLNAAQASCIADYLGLVADYPEIRAREECDKLRRASIRWRRKSASIKTARDNPGSGDCDG